MDNKSVKNTELAIENCNLKPLLGNSIGREHSSPLKNTLLGNPSPPTTLIPEVVFFVNEITDLFLIFSPSKALALNEYIFSKPANALSISTAANQSAKSVSPQLKSLSPQGIGLGTGFRPFKSYQETAISLLFSKGTRSASDGSSIAGVLAIADMFEGKPEESGFSLGLTLAGGPHLYSGPAFGILKMTYLGPLMEARWFHFYNKKGFFQAKLEGTLRSRLRTNKAIISERDIGRHRDIWWRNAGGTIGEHSVGSRDQILVVLKPYENLPRLELVESVIEHGECGLESVRLLRRIGDVGGKLFPAGVGVGQEYAVAGIGGLSQRNRRRCSDEDEYDGDGEERGGDRGMRGHVWFWEI
ncbi:hypothetical protein G2W53_034527 [Senna tora]|uniref:Uncharacterized protein n=1 Tax=Senna tora TaxID=362788 RepID=A0A834T1G1_9FABA|nr:hypothetical protein G2W53_034527 [Senna tora]